MDISITALQERLSKAQQRAEKARISHENWKSECERIAIALSVFAEMTGEISSEKPAQGRSTASQQVVKNSLGVGEENARSPMEIFEIVQKIDGFKNDINYVRTTLWRLGRDGLIGNANGRYWHLQNQDSATNPESLLHNIDTANIDMSSTRVRSVIFDDDLLDDESEVPF